MASWSNLVPTRSFLVDLFCNEHNSFQQLEPTRSQEKYRKCGVILGPSCGQLGLSTVWCGSSWLGSILMVIVRLCVRWDTHKPWGCNKVSLWASLALGLATSTISRGLLSTFIVLCAWHNHSVSNKSTCQAITARQLLGELGKPWRAVRTANNFFLRLSDPRTLQRRTWDAHGVGAKSLSCVSPLSRS